MSAILNEVSHYVSKLLSEKLSPNLVFHNLEHTLQTVDAAQKIAKGCKLKDDEIELVSIAAWFHDTGYTEMYEGHEEKSAQIAEKFLKEKNYPQQKIDQVKKIILATNMKNEPQTKAEKVMRDADIAHLGKKSGQKRGKLLRKELELAKNKKFTDKEWLEVERNFYACAKFYTDFAKENFQKRLLKNLAKIHNRIAKKENTMGEDKTEKISEKDIKKLQKIKMSERGVETVFRTTSRNHLRLSAIADNKANTLISIGALIISILLSFLVQNLDVQTFLIFPTTLLLVTCVVTIIFATLSTRPKVTKLGLSKDDIKQRKGNLLFFGNFYQMPLEDYEWGMQELMTDRDYLYSNLTKDIYFLGLVLAKKYKYLSLAYNIFMYGMIISVLTFLISIISNS